MAKSKPGLFVNEFNDKKNQHVQTTKRFGCDSRDVPSR